MRIAVFSDVHSSCSKMLAVFRDMEEYGIDQYICLGDIIGYGHQAEETVRLLMSRQVVAVRGNHELAMFDPDYLELFPKRIKQPLLDNMAALSTASVRYLENTPACLSLENCHFVHGAPPDKITTYIHDVSDYYLKSHFNNSDKQVFFTGHTHELGLITYSDKNFYRRRIRENCTIPLGPDRKYLLNVGSIAFSRDEFEESKYAVYDSRKKELMIRMVKT
nr:metallophosphoesterase family protein [Desulfobacula sp.]